MNGLCSFLSDKGESAVILSLPSSPSQLHSFVCEEQLLLQVKRQSPICLTVAQQKQEHNLHHDTFLYYTPCFYDCWMQEML